MNKKLAFALSLLGCCALTVGSTFAVHKASAESFIKSDNPLDTMGNIYNNDDTYYNPYSPFLFYGDVYNPQYTGAYYLYTYSFPEVYGTTFKNAGVPSTDTDYGGCFSSYLDSNNSYYFFINDGSQLDSFTLEAYGSVIMCDYLDDIFITSPVPCNIGLTTFYYIEEETNYGHFSVTSQDSVEWEYGNGYYTISLGALCRILIEERDNVKLWNYDSYYVETFCLFFTPLDTCTELSIYDFTETENRCPIGRGMASKAVFGHIPVVQDPSDTFTFIIDSVTSFLDTEFLPNLSFGKILLIILGIVVFGLGLKIAFGG